MSVELIAFDLDGTVLIDHKEIPQENIDAMIKAYKKGVYIVPATGRIASFLPKELLNSEFCKYALTCNGGNVYNIKTMECIHGAYIDSIVAKKVYSVIKKYNLYMEFYVKGGTPYTKTTTTEKTMQKYNMPEEKRYFLTKNYSYFDDITKFLNDENRLYEKINLTYIPQGIREEVRNTLNQIPEISVCSSIPDNLEINSFTAGKGNALMSLCKHLNIDIKNAMAIGDGENDVSMLEVAGVSVAMGNACGEALNAAKIKTTDCNDCGFAKAVYDFVL